MMNLTTEEKKYLLALARQVISLNAKGKTYHAEKYFSTSLKQKTGLFVTLKKFQKLRGCIGYVEGIKSLQRAAEEMAIAAAFEDPRFPPVSKDEIKDLEIEISVLSPLQKIADTNQIEIGKHGIIIEQNLMRGLLLPQVATEYNWDVQTFLEQTCLKAGLPADAWREKSTTIKIFSTDIFSDSDFTLP
jgi:AmmeMemoRadiSam system protein A